MEAASTSGRGSQGCTGKCNLGRRGWRCPPARVLRLRSLAAVQIGGLEREPVPAPKGWQPAVVSGTRTKPTPLFSAFQLVERLQRTLHPYAAENFGAFYSSIVGGIVTDPALALLPVDDQLYLKGHGLAEVVILRDGHLYMLDRHLERMEETCERLAIPLPMPLPALKRVLLDTAAASGKLNGQLRFWVTAGRGSFSPFEPGGAESALYALCLGDVYEIDRTEAFDAIVWPAPIYPTEVSDIFSNQLLLTTVAQLKAKMENSQLSIFIDEEGFVQHCAGYTLCILTKTDVLIFPPFENTPPSITLERILQLIPAERERSPNDVVVGQIQQRRLHISEVQAAKEAFVVCTPYLLAPVRSVDGVPVADNATGLTTLALHYTLDNDMTPPKPGVFSPIHTPVPYGYTSGMRSQLT